MARQGGDHSRLTKVMMCIWCVLYMTTYFPLLLVSSNIIFNTLRIIYSEIYLQNKMKKKYSAVCHHGFISECWIKHTSELRCGSSLIKKNRSAWGQKLFRDTYSLNISRSSANSTFQDIPDPIILQDKINSRNPLTRVFFWRMFTKFSSLFKIGHGSGRKVYGSGRNVRIRTTA